MFIRRETSEVAEQSALDSESPLVSIIVLAVTGDRRTFFREITRMKVLIVGSGGREHALAWTLQREDAPARRIRHVGLAPLLSSGSKGLYIGSKGLYGVRAR